jgi:hypothetical protein
MNSTPRAEAGISGTLIVAILALITSVSSLTWQVVLFLLGGSRIRTELRIGALGPGGAVHSPPDAPMDAAELTAQGYTEPVFAVQVQNRGRLAVSVTKWDVVLDNGSSFFQPGWHVNKAYSLPYRLEPGDEAIWFCPAMPVHAAIKVLASSSRPVRLIRARVGLGTGRSVTSKNSMPTHP